jgi:hypothetical protein
MGYGSPSWGKLPTTVRKLLVANDARFLARQLENERLRLMLVNGIGVLKELARSMAGQLEAKEVDPITGYGYRPTRLFTGKSSIMVRVIAWSTNVQSSHGVTMELRKELAERAAALAGVGRAGDVLLSL